MKDIHPLKRKSIKPSSSTVRGMLPGPQFRALDAAMQSLRSAGMRLEWQWKNKDIGWVCVGLQGDVAACELRPTEQPLIGVVELTRDQLKKALTLPEIPTKFKSILKVPMSETKSLLIYELPLETTQQRDMMSDFVESLSALFESDAASD